MKKTITVVDMRNGNKYIYIAKNEEDAVLNAYAQIIHNDFNTWNYRKYKKRIQHGKWFVFCGCFAAKKEVM